MIRNFLPPPLSAAAGNGPYERSARLQARQGPWEQSVTWATSTIPKYHAGSPVPPLKGGCRITFNWKTLRSDPNDVMYTCSSWYLHVSSLYPPSQRRFRFPTYSYPHLSRDSVPNTHLREKPGFATHFGLLALHYGGRPHKDNQFIILQYPTAAPRPGQSSMPAKSSWN